MVNLAGKSVLIFGGTSGIGFAVAEACLREQVAVVFVSSSNQERVEGAVRKLLDAKLGPGKVRGRAADAKSEAAIKAVLEEAGEVDHIVWTSGDKVQCFFPEAELQEAKDAFDVRFWGPVIVARHAHFRPGGSFTLTGSSTIIRPAPKLSLVSSAVGAVQTFCRGLALDLAPLRVNVVHPGVVDTELWKTSRTELKDATFDFVKNAAPVKHVGTADEIAEAYIFLMKCSYITGQSLRLDGGFTFV